jgi:hypothetical protein
MDLTVENKAHIDAMTYEQLLSSWRFAPSSDPWFQGETGEYWGERMERLRGADHAQISKKVGWR